MAECPLVEQVAYQKRITTGINLYKLEIIMEFNVKRDKSSRRASREDVDYFIHLMICIRKTIGYHGFNSDV
jgi:hypothetical protein